MISPELILSTLFLGALLLFLAAENAIDHARSPFERDKTP